MNGTDVSLTLELSEDDRRAIAHYFGEWEQIASVDTCRRWMEDRLNERIDDSLKVWLEEREDTLRCD